MMLMLGASDARHNISKTNSVAHRLLEGVGDDAVAGGGGMNAAQDATHPGVVADFWVGGDAAAKGLIDVHLYARGVRYIRVTMAAGRRRLETDR